MSRPDPTEFLAFTSGVGGVDPTGVHGPEGVSYHRSLIGLTSASPRPEVHVHNNDRSTFDATENTGWEFSGCRSEEGERDNLVSVVGGSKFPTPYLLGREFRLSQSQYNALPHTLSL